MRTAFRWALTVTAFLAGILGGYVSYLRSQPGADSQSLAVLLVVSAVTFAALLRYDHPDGPAVFLVPWLSGVIVACAVVGYCWPSGSIGIGIAALLCWGLLVISRVTRSMRRVMVTLIVVVLGQWAVFGVDHLALGGRLAVFKWVHINHPFFFTPYEIRPAEREGRKAVYVFDLNGADPTAVAFVWGWSLFPKIVDLPEARPEGSLLANRTIQEVIR